MQIEILKAKKTGYTARAMFFDIHRQRETSLFLCSKFDPIEEAKKWAESIYNEQAEMFIVYGVGFGYHIKALDDLLLEHQKIYAFDFNLEIAQQLKDYTKEVLNKTKQVEVMITEQVTALHQLLHEVEEESVKLAVYSPMLKVIPERFIGIKEALEIQYVMKHSRDLFQEMINRNKEENMKLQCENVSCFWNKFEGKTMALISGGPSLTDSIEMLKTVQEEVVIFATGRVIKHLMESGIKVDFFCIIDPQDDQTYIQIQGIEQEHIPLIFLNTASHFTVCQYKGPKYIAFNSDMPEEQEGRIETGGSVATAALELGIRFGFKTILFLGQDLAYTRGLTHAEGSRGQEVSGTEYMRKVKGVQGDFIPTSSALLSFKRWIENKISKHPEIEFINCSQVGAYIEGCGHMSLEEWKRRNLEA